MASNIIQRTIPSFWSSAHDDIIFEFDFTPEAIDSIIDEVAGSVSSGNARVNLQDAFDPVPVPGDRVYISTGAYTGIHTIVSVTGDSSIVIDTPFIGSVVSNAHNVYHLRVPEFNFYKGYDVSEFFTGSTPLTLVATLIPSVIFDSDNLPYLLIDVKGLAMRLFTIATKSDTVDNIDFAIYNVIRFKWDDQVTVGTYFNYVNVLNCAITNDELNERYLVRGYYLTPIDKPIIFSEGTTFTSKFDGDRVPVLEKYINGILQ